MNYKQKLKGRFGSPLLVLKSPKVQPKHLKAESGRIFTTFLSETLTAFCMLSNISQITQENFVKCELHLDSTLKEIESQLELMILKSKQENREHESAFLADFVQDEFLRMFVLKAIFSIACFDCNKLIPKGPQYHPKIFPLSPKLITENDVIRTKVRELGRILKVSHLYK